jgi:hypothetical protein
VDQGPGNARPFLFWNPDHTQNRRDLHHKSVIRLVRLLAFQFITALAPVCALAQAADPAPVVARYRAARTATMQATAGPAELEALGSLLADSALYEHAQAGAVIAGREAILAGIRSFLGTTRNARIQVLREIVVADAVASEELVTFEMRRDTAWVPMNRTQLTVYRVSGNRIVEESQSWSRDLPAGVDVVQRPFPADARWYDFWEGTWHRLVDGRPDTTGTRFIVRRGVHASSWEEDWRMRLDSVTVVNAHAVRSWDATRGRWGYLWVSANGHFQEWEGRKVGADWYIYRRFDFPNDRYLSRQAWLPLGPDRVRRISQKSYDNGATWETRFDEEYGRAK